MTSIPRTFESGLAELTVRWNAHHELRRTGAPIADLVASRQALDTARARVRALRAA